MSDPFRSVVISIDLDHPWMVGRFMPTDPTRSYWDALEAAEEYLDAKYPRWQRLSASREWYPMFVKLEFVIGESSHHAEL